MSRFSSGAADAGLYVVDVDEPIPDRCRVRAWRPGVDGVSEVFHARIVDFGYPPHCHDTWAVLILDDGAISYDLDSRRCGAVGQTVSILPPGVTHDGRPAPGANGFTKRVLYLDPSFLPDSLVGAAVDRTNLDDAALRHALASLHQELSTGADAMSAESSLALIAERLTRHLARTPADPARPDPRLARRLRSILDDRALEPVTLSDAATELGRSTPHLIRSFTSAYGISPHAYLVSRRVDHARTLLLDGVPASRAAVESGFHDQSHLTRHFRRHTSVPPATFAGSRPATARPTPPLDRAERDGGRPRGASASDGGRQSVLG